MTTAGHAAALKQLEFQEYALAIVVVLLFVGGRDPQAGHVPHLGQRPQHAHPGERRRRARHRHDVRDRDGRHRPLGGLDGRRGGRVRRHPARATRGPARSCSSSGAVVFATGLGTVNAVSVAYGRVVPFIATLAMFSIGKGIALLLNDKLPVSLLDLNGGSFGDPAVGSLLWFGNGRILGIPVSVYVFLAVTVAGWILLNRTRYGRYVVAVGGNREAARIAGVPVRRIIFSVYVLSGILAGVATVLLCARLGSASPVSGNLYELDAIGAVVIGGTSLAGGRASIVGTFLGVLTFALIFSLMTQMNLSTEVQQVTKGAIVLGAVLLQRPEARY